jgi:hypothetical protein
MSDEPEPTALPAVPDEPVHEPSVVVKSPGSRTPFRERVCDPRLGQWFPPERLTAGLRHFILEVDAVEVDARVPTMATRIERGKITLMLSPASTEWHLEARIEGLAHECGHICLGHRARGERLAARLGEPLNHEAWNAVGDATIHACGVARADVLDTVVPGGVVTFERLKLPECPAEVAYEMLPKVPLVGAGTSCGRHAFAEQDAESAGRAAVLGAVISALEPERWSRGASNNPSVGVTIGELPPVPRWIRRVLSFLTTLPRRDERRRSWQREHRRLGYDLPGRVRAAASGALFIADGSGSTQADFPTFVSAVAGTPELRFSDVVFFDTAVTAVVPVSSRAAVLAEAKKVGGGTDFLPPAALRTPDRISVWITDGYPCGEWPGPGPMGDIWIITTDVRPPHGRVFYTSETGEGSDG